MSWRFVSNHSISPDVPLDDVSVVVAGDELRVESLKIDHCLIKFVQPGSQCLFDHIAQYVKVLGTKIAHKFSPKISWVLGLFWKHHFLLKITADTFFGNFWGKLGYF